MGIAGTGDIIKFLLALATGGASLVSVGAGAFFMWSGLTFSKAAVTTCALGLAAPIGLVATGAVLVGAGIWLAYVNGTK